MIDVEKRKAVFLLHERHYLLKLPAYLPAPYLIDERDTDQYGYAAFDGNYYWAPGTSRQDVNVFEYADSLKIHQRGQCVASAALRWVLPSRPRRPCLLSHRRSSKTSWSTPASFCREAPSG